MLSTVITETGSEHDVHQIRVTTSGGTAPYHTAACDCGYIGTERRDLDTADSDAFHHLTGEADSWGRISHGSAA
ncbi:MAG: hypothetical protein ABI729_04195 [Chitinophagales bacterium]